MKRLMNLSIKQRLILGIASIHAILMLSFIYDMISRQKVFLVAQYFDIARSTSESLVINSMTWLLANDYSGLQEIVSLQKNRKDLNLVMVLTLSLIHI